MKPPRLRLLVLTVLLLGLTGAVRAADPAKTENATTLALKKITERYALTRLRIDTLIGSRLNPPALAANLPNPFYAAPALPPAETTAPVEDIVPTAPDSSDADTLARYAAALKISGGMVINGQPLLTINSALYKVGDVIPVGTKSKQVYLQVLRITPTELTLGLNEVQQVVTLKR
jgi:hypothetical protein